MQRSLAHRAFGKAQTTLVKGLMRASGRLQLQDEDIHLLHYTNEQREAEAKIPPDYHARKIAPCRLLIVIPFRDKWEMTRRCLDGILIQNRDALTVMVALVDNGSVEDETREGISEALSVFEKAGITARHMHYEIPFNFSFLNNQAVRDSSFFSPDVIALINNDIEFLDQNALRELVRGTQLPDAGAIGATLLYPDRLVQHLFVFVGSKIVGAHPFKGKPLNRSAQWYRQPRAVGAVTGAVMFVKTKDFLAVGGLDEELPTSYQDVDLCLKLQKIGLVNWVQPSVMFIHHETQTRSREPSWKEAERVEKRWGDYLLLNPFVSDVWSRRSEQFVYTPAAFFRALVMKDDKESISTPAHPLSESPSRPLPKS